MALLYLPYLQNNYKMIIEVSHTFVEENKYLKCCFKFVNGYAHSNYIFKSYTTLFCSFLLNVKYTALEEAYLSNSVLSFSSFYWTLLISKLLI